MVNVSAESECAVTESLCWCTCAFASVADVLACRIASRGVWTLSLEKKWLKRCVLSGNVLPRERRGLWWHLTGVRALQSRLSRRVAVEEGTSSQSQGFRGLNAEGVFEILSMRPLREEQVSEIERDVNRTFPTHFIFKGSQGAEGRKRLTQVLRAIVVAEPCVGYCQGMNFVAATLIIHLGSACDAFWILLALIDCYGYRNVFSPGVPLLPLRVFQFSRVVKAQFPRLWRHMQCESSSLDIFAQQCVLTLFAYSIEPNFLVHVYDVFFFVGWKAVFRVGLGFLAPLESQLLRLGIEDISRFLHQSKQKYEHRDLEKLLRYKVSNSLLQSLEVDFQMERWQELLDHVEGYQSDKLQQQSRALVRALPVGVERTVSGSGLLLQRSSLSAVNTPQWRRASARLSGSERPEALSGRVVSDLGADELIEGDACHSREPVRVTLDGLWQRKGDLDAWDLQTQEDVAAFRAKVAKLEQRLDETRRGSLELREEVQRLGLMRQEWQAQKRALMESLQQAVQTSAANALAAHKAGGMEMNSPVPVVLPPTRDRVVLECMDTLKRAESESFDRLARCRSKMKELEPVDELIQELTELKARAIEQLQAFLVDRTMARRRFLEASFREVVAL